MWTLLSFTGRFDVAFLEEAIAKGEAAPPKMPGETTETQKQRKREAHMARARLRRGAMLQRLQEKRRRVQSKEWLLATNLVVHSAALLSSGESCSWALPAKSASPCWFWVLSSIVASLSRTRCA